MKKIRKKYKINKFRFTIFVISILTISIAIIILVIFINNNSLNISVSANNLINIETTEMTKRSLPSQLDENVIEKKEEIIDYSIKPDELNVIYYEHMFKISKNENVPIEIILAIVTTENETYDANITCKNTNGTMDMGLCQINSSYVDYFAKIYSIDNLDPYDVCDSITFVARHMKYLSNYAIEEYNMSLFDSYIFAAGAYNRGLSNECKYGNMYSYKEEFLNNYYKFVKGD